MRTHGFERPFHPFQVASWLVFGSDVLVYLACVFSLVDHDVKLVLAPLYLGTVVVLVAATAKATRCNAADPHVQLQDDAMEIEEDDSMPYCGLCNVPVFPRSKHCRVCSKCVDIFDHHCMWINNCIGRANYKSFFVTISSVALMIGTVLATCAYLLITYFTDQDAFQQRLEGTPVMCEIPKETFLGLLITMLLINMPLFVLDMQLVLLHMFLMSQGLTTYEYIMNKRDSMDRSKEPGAGTGSDEYGRATKSRAQASPAKAVKSLPRCMDWIFFCSCGKRRRRPSPKRGGELHDQACVVDGSPAAVQMGHPCGVAGSSTTGASPQKIGLQTRDEDDEGTDVGSPGVSDASAGGPTAVAIASGVDTPDFGGVAWQSGGSEGSGDPATAQAGAETPSFSDGLPAGASERAALGQRPPGDVSSGAPCWEAGRRYRLRERLRMREGPEPTSTEVGVVAAGSLLAVWETCRSSAGAKCAFVSVQDGPGCGQQGWVRCVGNPTEEPLPASAAGVAGGCCGEEDEEIPAKRTLTPPSAQSPRHLDDIHLTESPRNRGGLIYRLPDALEDRLFDESSVLQEKEHPCPTCGCGPVRRCGGHPGRAEAVCTTGGSAAAGSQRSGYQAEASKQLSGHRCGCGHGALASSREATGHGQTSSVY